MVAIAIASLAAVAVLAAAPAAHAADRVYWSNFSGNSISWVDTDGSGGGDLDTGAATMNGPMGLALDPVDGIIYWANWNGATPQNGDTISWAALDGSAAGDLPINTALVNGPHGLAIDQSAGRIYWANYADSTIGSANLNGGNAELLPTPGVVPDGPRGLAIDPATSRIYWANHGNVSMDSGTRISYAKLDGSGGDDLVVGDSSTLEGPEGVAIDHASARIYWGDYSALSKISYSSLDGTGGITNVNTMGATTDHPHGVAVDAAAGRIYWVNTFPPGSVSFANLDGSGGDDLIAGDTNSPPPTINDPDQPLLFEPPKGIGEPVISGASAPGSTLSCGPGSWAGDLAEALLYRAPASFAYRWTRDGADVGGATQSSIVAANPGDYRCRVAATNGAGSTSQTSAPLTVGAGSGGGGAGDADHARTIKLRYRHHAFVGRLKSADAECVAGQKVKVFRKRPGADRRVGRDRSGNTGRFSIAAPHARGRNYAVSPASTVADGTCAPAKSKSKTAGA